MLSLTAVLMVAEMDGRQNPQAHIVLVMCCKQGQVWDATRPRFDSQALVQQPRPTLSSLEEEAEPEVDAEEWRQRLRGKRY